MGEEDKLEEAKKVILDYLDKMLTVKNTRWVYDEVEKEYIEVDAGYTEKEMEITRRYHYQDYKQYFKLRDKIDDLL